MNPQTFEFPIRRLRPMAAMFLPSLRGTLILGMMPVLVLPFLHVAAGGTPAALVSLNNTSTGGAATASLTSGSDGNLYGTTFDGGSGAGEAGHGTAFVLTAGGTLTTLYTFTGGTDGANPTALAQASDGNFYGATITGGANGYGTLFRLTTVGTLTTLHAFTDGADGAASNALVADGAGNLYGTTSTGGANGDGTVYELSTGGTFTTLYAFSGGTDGASPLAALVLGSNGNLYGTTAFGGDAPGYDGSGTVFAISTAGALTTLHAFDGAAEGSYPFAPVIQGTDSALYGTTSGSAAGSNYGTAFRVTTDGATFTTLHAFTNGADGDGPAGGLVQDASGTLYGTTHTGGYRSDGSFADGTLFSLTTGGTLTTLYTFDGSVSGEGYNPTASLVKTSTGTVYGTTTNGGTSDAGLVYSLATTHPAFFTGETALSNGVYYLAFPSGNYFGYYTYLTDSNYIYHFDLGYEYVFDANDGNSGVYFYDFASSDFFYTSPSFPFPYLYDFNLKSVLYYYPDTSNAGHYTTSPRSFYDYATGQIITK